MPEIKFKTEILEAIDALRLSKNRPNLKRISNYVRKHYLVSPMEFKSSLKKCLDSGDVFAVDFKGCTSFRNAAKSKHGRYKTAYIESGHHNNLLNSIIKLLQKEVYKQTGLSVLCIKRVVCSGETSNQRQFVVSTIKRGLFDGIFVRLPNKNIALKTYFPDIKAMDTDEDIMAEETKFRLDTSQSPDINNIQGSDEQKINTEGEASIISGRRKRSKKIMFDPSDNNIPRKRSRQSTIPVGSTINDVFKRKQKSLQNIKTKRTIIDLESTHIKEESLHSFRGSTDNDSVCVVCLLEVKNSLDEPMILCKNCTHRAHISCLNIKDGRFRMGRDGIWKCPDCKICVVCLETSEAGRLTVCAECTDPYHALCHAPRIRESYINSNDWQCCNCKPAGSDSALSDDSIFFNEEKPRQNLLDDSHSESFLKRNVYSNRRVNPSSSILTKIKSQQFDSNCSTSSQCQLSNFENLDIDLKKYSYYADYLKYKTNHEKLHGKKINTYGKYDCDENVPVDPTIPDARLWTVDDVYHYFARLFPEDAVVFKKEKIDGLALLLMNRNNIVEDLKLNLGVSLKIYRHVVLLQERRENTRRLYL